MASSNQVSVCAYCGSAEAPKHKGNSVGALVDQLLGEVQLGAQVSASVKRRNVHFVQSTTFNVNGTQYESIEQLPRELRQAVESGLATVEQLGRNKGASASTHLSVASDTQVENAEPERSNGTAARRVVVALIVVVLMLMASLVGALLTQP